MQLTGFTDYALRVLIYVATGNGRQATIREVSAAHGISVHHLTKVVHRLSTLGYVRAVRGKGGGIGPARPPSEISIGRLIRDIEPLVPVECFAAGYDGRCILFPACGLRGALHAAQEQYLKTLDGYSIADVAAGMGGRTAAAPRRATGARASRTRP